MRGKPAPKRNIQPDLRYNNAMVARFINHVLQRGKKRTAERVLYDSFDLIKEKTGKDPVAVFEEAMKVIAPTIEVNPDGSAEQTIKFLLKLDLNVV